MVYLGSWDSLELSFRILVACLTMHYTCPVAASYCNRVTMRFSGSNCKIMYDSCHCTVVVPTIPMSVFHVIMLAVPCTCDAFREGNFDLVRDPHCRDCYRTSVLMFPDISFDCREYILCHTFHNVLL